MLLERRELDKEMQQVNKHMLRLLKSENLKMQEVMNWVLQEKGKQLRPKLVILSSKFGSSQTDPTEYAAVVEIIHMASLVHDDVIDDADTRRGRMSVQKKFGKNMAVYAGDYMIFSSFGSGNLEYQDAYKKIYGTMKKVFYGELGQNEMLYDMNVSVAKYIENITGKTASMFELACEVGGIVGEVTEDVAKNLAEYGKYLGILFQIQDDLLDYRSAEKTIGKPIYQDFANGIYTLPILYALKDRKLKKRLKEIQAQIKDGELTKEQCDELTEIIQSVDGFGKCYSIAKEYYTAAMKAVEKLPDQPEKNELQNILNMVYESI